MSKPPKQARTVARTLFRACLSEGKLDESRTRHVVQLILESKRRRFLVVLGEIRRLLRIQRARQTASVGSAISLNSELLTRIRKCVEHSYGDGITTIFAQDSSLIGGIRIQVGCDVYDGSVKAKLAALNDRFGISSNLRKKV